MVELESAYNQRAEEQEAAEAAHRAAESRANELSESGEMQSAEMALASCSKRLEEATADEEAAREAYDQAAEMYEAEINKARRDYDSKSAFEEQVRARHAKLGEERERMQAAKKKVTDKPPETMDKKHTKPRDDEIKRLTESITDLTQEQVAMAKTLDDAVAAAASAKEVLEAFLAKVGPALTVHESAMAALAEAEEEMAEAERALKSLKERVGAAQAEAFDCVAMCVQARRLAQRGARPVAC